MTGFMSAAKYLETEIDSLRGLSKPSRLTFTAAKPPPDLTYGKAFRNDYYHRSHAENRCPPASASSGNQALPAIRSLIVVSSSRWNSRGSVLA
jgi:hypothetical protein